MNNKLLFFIAALLCTVFQLHSQEDVRIFKSQEYTQSFVVTDPKYYPNKKEIEGAFKDFLNVGEVEDVSLNLIFHNLYSTSSEMIPQFIIERQVELLNENFSSAKYPDPLTSDYHEKFENRYCENTRINFCLVNQQTLDKNGAPFKPLNHKQVVRDNWPINNEMKNPISGHPVVLPELLINVWIVDLEENYAGFSQVPGGNSNFDGIVIDYKLLRNIDVPSSTSKYNEGKSLTHLIANYLNVNDLWNEHIPCGDDSARDTPIHNAPNYHCYESLHMTTCEKKASVEMLNNFMDATPDACQYYFTSNQMMRMQSILSKEGFRHSLTGLGCDVHFTNSELASSRKSQDEIGFNIFPNPSNGQFSMEFYGLPKSTRGFVSVIDVNGNSILEMPISDIKEQLNLTITPISSSQIYFVKFISNHGKSIINRLIINQ